MSFLLLIFLFFCVNSEKLEVFVIPHTHIDQGWLSTIDGYRGKVENILRSVVESLRNDGNRIFNWAEVYYFRDWYSKLSDKDQKFVDHLIFTRRFHFVGGGVVQNDEACPSYQSIIEQFHVGRVYLQKQFNISPKYAWQIDPFGHDIRMAQILSELDYRGVVLNRVHYKIKDAMRASKSLDFVWDSGCGKIVTHVLWKHYSAPQGFDFEGYGGSVSDNNIKSRSENLMRHLRSLQRDHKHNHLLIPVGDDFRFGNAEAQYRSWDKLIAYINKHNDDVNIRYARVDEYFESLENYVLERKDDENMRLPVVSHDFFPYADNFDAWWTGYYTTWAGMKRLIRKAEEEISNAQFVSSVAKNLQLTLPSENIETKSDEEMKNLMKDLDKAIVEVNVATHHDYITGTSPRKTIDDYFKRLHSAESHASEVSKKSYKKIINFISSSSEEEYDLEDVDNFLLDPSDKHYNIFIGNPSGRTNSLVRIYSTSSDVEVSVGGTGINIPVQVFPYVSSIDPPSFSKTDDLIYVVYFDYPLDGHSFDTLKVKVNENSFLEKETESYLFDPKNQFSGGKFNNVLEIMRSYNSGTFSLENSRTLITFHERTGFIRSVVDKVSQRMHDFGENDLFREFHTSSSGAYIFRASNTAATIENNPVDFLYVIRGTILDYAFISTGRIKYELFLKHLGSSSESEMSELFPLNKMVEMRFRIEELPGNRELVLQLLTDDENLIRYSLDTYNGMFFVPRNTEHATGKFPISGRFYPSPSGLVFRNVNSQITVFTNSMMAVSAQPNKAQLLLHRRLSRDDGRGMGQGNNDNHALVGRLLFSYENPSDGRNVVELEKNERLSELFNRPPKILISKMESIIPRTKVLTIPENLDVVQMKVSPSDEDKVIIRLRNRNYLKEVDFNLGSNTQNSLLLMPKILYEWTYSEVFNFVEGKEIFFNIASGNVETVSVRKSDSISFGSPTYLQEFQSSRETFKAKSNENGVIRFKPREIITLEMYVQFKIENEQQIVKKEDNTLALLKEIDEEDVIEESDRLNEIYKELEEIEEKKKRSDFEKWKKVSDRNRIPTTGILKPRKTMFIYFIFLFMTIVLLFLIFSSRRKARRVKAVKKIPLREISVKTRY